VILAKITDPMERDIPEAKFIAGDVETQITVDGTDKKIRSRFSEGFESDFQSFQTEMKKHHVPVFTINTIGALDQQIKDVFKGNSG
jgi:hypothetical protein